jgi:putative oxidoreductase
MKKLLHLDFLPRSADLALLTLRLWYGLAMLLLHGWGKLVGFTEMSAKFSGMFGLSPKATLSLAIVGEVVCTVLIVVGLWTRLAALGAAITMFVAFWIAHGHKLTGPGSGEMAFLYLGAFVALFLAGGGRYALDAKLGAKG